MKVLFIFLTYGLVQSVLPRSLWDILCDDQKQCGTTKQERKKISKNYLVVSPHFGAPSRTETTRWNNYERLEPGTGLHPDSGPGFGPGLGDIAINTGIGVQHPYGGLLIRRDFGINMGGSGRSGGRAFGWGNGAPFIQGVAPWSYPV